MQYQAATEIALLLTMIDHLLKSIDILLMIFESSLTKINHY